MKKSDVQIGMKVVPTKKTAPGWGNFRDCVSWLEAKSKNQEFLYVVGYSHLVERDLETNYEEEYFHLNVDCKSGGDFFRASDFRPYKETK